MQRARCAFAGPPEADEGVPQIVIPPPYLARAARGAADRVLQQFASKQLNSNVEVDI